MCVCGSVRTEQVVSVMFDERKERPSHTLSPGFMISLSLFFAEHTHTHLVACVCVCACVCAGVWVCVCVCVHW